MHHSSSGRALTVTIAIACSIVTAVLVSSVSAFADSDPATDAVPRLIPYHGTLDKDGTPVTGSISMIFRLYDASDPSTPVWEETQEDVAIHRGRFSVLLGATGTQAALAKAITDADDLSMAVVLKTATEEIPLANRKRFLPMPYALWTTASTDFHVGNNLTVGNGVSVGNGLTVGSGLAVGEAAGAQIVGNSSIDGDLTVSQTLTAGSAQVTGDAGVQGNLDVGGRLDIAGEAPVEFLAVTHVGPFVPVGRSTDQWNCAVASAQTTDAGAVAGIDNSRFSTVISGSDWVVLPTIFADPLGATRVGVVCFKRAISTRTSWL